MRIIPTKGKVEVLPFWLILLLSISGYTLPSKVYGYKCCDMTINVNNQPRSILKDSSIKKLLEQLNIVTNGIAVAVNNEVVSRENWNETVLQKEDHVMIIQASQGG